MKTLNELQGYDKIRKKVVVDKSADKYLPMTNRLNLLNQIRDNMEENGFKFLGRGDYGITFMGKNKVVKFFMDDPAYEDFVNKTKTLYMNKYKNYFPKFSPVYTIKLDDIEIKVLKTELLYELNDYDKNLLNNYRGYFNDFVSYGLGSNAKPIKPNIPNALSFWNKLSPKSQERIYEFVERFEKIIQILSDVHSKYGITYNLDIHGGNIMQRANGELVITDPWTI